MNGKYERNQEKHLQEQKCGCGWKGDLGTFACIGRVFFLKLVNGWGVQVCNIIIILLSCLK